MPEDSFHRGAVKIEYVVGLLYIVCGNTCIHSHKPTHTHTHSDTPEAFLAQAQQEGHLTEQKPHQSATSKFLNICEWKMPDMRASV